MALTRLVAAMLVAAAAASANAAPSRGVVEQLKRIRTVAGVNVYERMQRCGIRIESSSGLDDGGSFTSAGEKQLNVFIDVPPMEDTQHDRDLFTGLNAIWVIHKDGRAEPVTGWAKTLEAKFPLGSPGWLNC